MSHPSRMGARVLKAVASSLRLQVLNMLLDRGPLSYTEIMNTLRLNPGRDAGRFAYHLKFLIKSDLVEPDAETKKYRLTDLGRMLVEVTETIDERAFKHRKMMVRTSRLAMEEFDRNKIASSLMKEANAPQDLAQKIARETEGRLLEVKAKYLTAPLIREFVNAILIEKGLEDYRHKLTRLGLPVYDVTQLIRSASANSLSVSAIHASAGDAVIEEYTLLNILPRDIADAHLSGSLHLSNLGDWILKPSEFAHDLRFFFKHGLQFDGPQLAFASSPPPKTLEAAFSKILNVLRATSKEVSGEQLLDYFNVFLAPFIRGIDRDRVRENLRLFLFNVSQTFVDASSALRVSIGIEPAIPDFLGSKEAVGPGGKKDGVYSNYAEESNILASLILEMIAQESEKRPLLQPSIIIKTRMESFRTKQSESVLNLAHQLAAEKGLPYFANLEPKEQTSVSYTATGNRLADDWRGDWELDTLRLGSIGKVSVNLPRISYESEAKMSRFYDLLGELISMALRAMEIKYQTIRQRGREGLLPLLTNKSSGEQYTRFDNSSRQIGLIGLNEAVETLCGMSVYRDSKAADLAEQIVKYVYNTVRKSVRKPESRPLTAIVPSKSAASRLARLDIEHYGWAKVHVSGTRDQPFYSDIAALPVKAKIGLDERLRVEEKMQQMTPGGHLVLMQIGEEESDADKLQAISRRLISDSRIGFYTFDRSFAYCGYCHRVITDEPTKCPFCGSVDNLVRYRRISAAHASVTG